MEVCRECALNALSFKGSALAVSLGPGVRPRTASGNPIIRRHYTERALGAAGIGSMATNSTAHTRKASQRSCMSQRKKNQRWLTGRLVP